MEVKKTATADLPSIARCKSTTEVADFLTKIGFSEYTESFRDGDISGEVLLDADPEMLTELGVETALHQMKIMQLFKRELKGTDPLYSRDYLNTFLADNNLSEYAGRLEEHGIDGDMIADVDVKIMKAVLKEIGITSSVDAGKICSKYKKLVAQ